MKFQLKIFPFLAGVVLFTATVFSFIDVENQNTSSFSGVKQGSRSSENVSNMIEHVKAPAYYTVFNVILNYLPLNK